MTSSSAGRGRAPMQPRQVAGFGKEAAELERQIAKVQKDVQAAASGPLPDDPKLRAAYQKEMAKLARTARELDRKSGDVSQHVVRAKHDVEGESKDRKHEDWVTIEGGFKAVDKGGTAVNRAVQKMDKAARSKPKPAAKQKRKAADAKKDVERLRQIHKTMEKVLRHLNDVSRSLLRALR